MSRDERVGRRERMIDKCFVCMCKYMRVCACVAVRGCCESIKQSANKQKSKPLDQLTCLMPDSLRTRRTGGGCGLRTGCGENDDDDVGGD